VAYVITKMPRQDAKDHADHGLANLGLYSPTIMPKDSTQVLRNPLRVTKTVLPVENGAISRLFAKDAEIPAELSEAVRMILAAMPIHSPEATCRWLDDEANSLRVSFNRLLSEHTHPSKMETPWVSVTATYLGILVELADKIRIASIDDDVGFLQKIVGKKNKPAKDLLIDLSAQVPIIIEGLTGQLARLNAAIAYLEVSSTDTHKIHQQALSLLAIIGLLEQHNLPVSDLAIESSIQSVAALISMHITAISHQHDSLKAFKGEIVSLLDTRLPVLQMDSSLLIEGSIKPAHLIDLSEKIRVFCIK
jgi:hypothetical protein